MEKKENTGTKLNVLLCNLVDYVRGDDRPLVFAVMQEITEYFEQELDKAREEGKREVLEEMIKENGGNIIPSPEAIPTLMFRREIREYLNNKLSKLKTKEDGK